jgi:hypothetical protein
MDKIPPTLKNNDIDKQIADELDEWKNSGMDPRGIQPSGFEVLAQVHTIIACLESLGVTEAEFTRIFKNNQLQILKEIREANSTEVRQAAIRQQILQGVKLQ